MLLAHSDSKRILEEPGGLEKPASNADVGRPTAAYEAPVGRCCGHGCCRLHTNLLQRKHVRHDKFTSFLCRFFAGARPMKSVTLSIQIAVDFLRTLAHPLRGLLPGEFSLICCCSHILHTDKDTKAENVSRNFRYFV